MTIIAAVRDPERRITWIGSDTLAVQGGTKMLGCPKWVVRKPWAVGVAGNLRTTNVIAAHANDLLNGLAGAYDFTCRARGLLQQDGYNTDTDEGAKAYGQNMILAHPGRVWSICVAFGVFDIPGGEVWADGSGRAYGLGAGHVAKGGPRARLRAAVEAAIRYDDQCGGEPWIDQLRG